MRIVPLTLLKPTAKGMITEIMTDKKEMAKAIQRLTDVGFVPGHEVKLQKSVGRLYRIKVGSDNPFAIRRNLAEQILVTAPDEDLYESFADAKKANSFIGDLKKIFSKFKRK